MVEELKAAIDAVRAAYAKTDCIESSEAYDLAYSRTFDVICYHGQALIEAVADAERYRWIREHSYVEFTCDSPRNVYMTNEQFDSYVDLARTKAGAGGEK
jgi:hypothetical protein